MDSPSLTTPSTPPKLDVAALPSTDISSIEVSMVEAEDVTGVTFSPDLWMQRRHWALNVLRKEGVRSVLDMGCGPGALLETLVIPPSTIAEPPILSSSSQASTSQLPSPVDSENDFPPEGRELFITRLGALDSSPNVIPSALSVLTPNNAQSAFPPRRPRWEQMTTELWLGGIEKYNSWLEGYEAIVGLELIEHLDPNVLSRFGVVTLGTYRPRLLLISTPNFDFNSKFPRYEDPSHSHSHPHPRGFIDPTGRTERVFRHSDHKVEMTSAEFREWAESAAQDWGYEVEVSGVGISSKPSYYPPEDKYYPNQPIFASQTAIFRLASGVPARSPRSVRSSELPFLSKESSRPHKLAGRSVWPADVPTGERLRPEEVRRVVRGCFDRWDVPIVSLEEVWGKDEVSMACRGSKRYLVGCLGGWGDVPTSAEDQAESSGGGEFIVEKQKDRGLFVRWASHKDDRGKRMDVDTA